MGKALAVRVLDRLNSFAQLQIAHNSRLAKAMDKELRSLTESLELIKAFSGDAEDKRMRDMAVSVLHDQIKYLLYEVDDLLDEWCTKILRSGPVNHREGFDDDDEKKMKVLFSCSSSSSSFFGLKPYFRSRKMVRTIKLINERIDVIAATSRRRKLNLNDDVIIMVEKTTPESPRIITSSSFITADDSIINNINIRGRELDEAKIVSMLIREASDDKLSLMTIVGMGGIGKTTLAQRVYNNVKVQSHFDKRIWVCVSDPFNVKNIVREILQSINNGRMTTDDNHSMDELARSLRESIQDKRFLLVLDDVWNEDHAKWYELKCCLEAGSQGSCVLVTTRSKKVGYMMSTNELYLLNGLSEADSWDLFRQIALVGRTDQECETLEDIGRKLVRLCGGNPLATKTLAGLMHFKKTREDWQIVLENHVWEEPERVLGALYLSYHSLPFQLKPCISFCSLFPKGYEINKDMLIKLWMAQGFLASKSMGDKYFHDLLQQSFFQDVEKDKFGQLVGCKIHDLVHDLLRNVTGNEFYMMETNNRELSLNVLHLSILNMDMDSIHPSVYKATHLLTLKLFNCRWSSPVVSPDLFHHLASLRALDLTCPDLEIIPFEVEKLIHLRYLDLSGTRLKCLPDTICNLYNLQTLKLNSCIALCKLPPGIKKLINLRHLEIDGTDSLHYLPLGIARLTSLQSLSKFIVGTMSGECMIGELKDLNLLQGNIHIKGLSRVENLLEASEAGLKSKQHLSGLTLDFSPYKLESVTNREVGRIETVLEGLQPHSNLKKLEVCYSDVSKFPAWMMSDSILSNLRILSVHNCRTCIELPAFGKLPSLQELRISELHEVRHINHEFYGIGSGDRTNVAFPMLEELHIVYMDNLQEWNLAVRENEKIMPCLHHLFLAQCPRLVSLPHSFLDTLKELHVSDCPELVMSLQRVPQLHEKLTLEGDIGILSKSLSIEEPSETASSVSGPQ